MVQTTDSNYTWDYRMRIFKDASVPKTLIKIFLFTVIAIMVFVLALALIEGDLTTSVFIEVAEGFGLVFLGLTVLTLLSYYVVFAAIHGGKYDIVYKMDDKGVSFITAKGTMDKVKKTALLGAVAGIAAGSLPTVGSSILAATRSSMYTKFAAVTKVVIYGRNKKLVLTESHIAKNHIYAQQDNFEQISKHILGKCTKAKVISKR